MTNTPIVALITLLVLAANNCPAQTLKAEILTNRSIIEVIKAGLGNDIILSKINSSTCRFDVSTPALIDLKKQGVPEAVISAMIGKTNRAATVDPAAGSTPVSKSGNLPAISQLNYVHSYENGKVSPLEKLLGKGTTKKKAFGYGGTELRVEVKGATSLVRLPQDAAGSFIINMGGNTLPDLALFKMKAEKDKRYAVTGLLTPSGPKSSDDMLQVELSKLGDGVYGIKISSKLEKGEYCFTSKPNLNQSTSASDVYAFTVQ